MTRSCEVIGHGWWLRGGGPVVGETGGVSECRVEQARRYGCDSPNDDDEDAMR